jgi:ADP-sugar diphosphatase
MKAIQNTLLFPTGQAAFCLDVFYFIMYQEEPKFLAWKSSLEKAGCSIRSVIPKSLFNKPSGELLFGVFEVDALAPEGHKILPIVVVRGNACVVVPLLRDRETGEEKFLMIRQRRTGNGRMNLEFPAGMLDRLVEEPLEVAAHELLEETGLSLDKSRLFPLFDKPLFTSVGLQDEAILYFGCIAEVSHGIFAGFEGKQAGAQSEDEHITVTLKTREEALAEAESGQVVLGLFLFESCQLRSA